MIKKILRKIVMWMMTPETKRLTADSNSELLEIRRDMMATGWRQVECRINIDPSLSYVLMSKE